LVRRRIRGIFDALSRGDYSLALDRLAEDVHHVFAGDHALGANACRKMADAGIEEAAGPDRGLSQGALADSWLSRLS
jgi:ketosteroid isomerase-like protein